MLVRIQRRRCGRNDEITRSPISKGIQQQNHHRHGRQRQHHPSPPEPDQIRAADRRREPHAARLIGDQRDRNQRARRQHPPDPAAIRRKENYRRQDQQRHHHLPGERHPVAHESGDAIPDVGAIKILVRFRRVLVLVVELVERQHRRCRGSDHPADCDPTNLARARNRRRHQRQHRVQHEFFHLRKPFASMTGRRHRNQRQDGERGERNPHGRDSPPRTSDDQRHHGRAHQYFHRGNRDHGTHGGGADQPRGNIFTERIHGRTTHDTSPPSFTPSL